MKQKPILKRETKSKPLTETEIIEKTSSEWFPVIGIGASAGGLEALEQLLVHIPANSGMAYVIVQHLDPTHQGIMPELLQRSTGMKVLQVKDRMRICVEHVYVIPPNKEMSVLHGVLHLLEPSAPRGLRLPIDFFLRSLAQDQQEKSIGVILSGMGSDGTLGLRAIKEKAGLVLVQEPVTAKYDSMPRSAIDAGLADVIAPVDQMPGRILAWLQRKPIIQKENIPLQGQEHDALEKAVILLRVHTGHDFSHYKRNTLYRRIERRMGLHQIEKIPKYIRYLQENPQELDLLFKELLIGVTNFFRDSATWEQLRLVIIPKLLKDRASGHALRVWVPGCSSGEEAYSMAMVLKEAADEISPKRHFVIQLFATDLDRDAIDIARAGFYTRNVAADVSPERLARFFSKEEGGYRVRSEIREMVIFAPQNLIMDPPFTKLDILSCRNLLIYLAPEIQKKLMPLFHYSLNSGGILFLGSSETVGNFTDLFAPIDTKARLFQRIDSGIRPESLAFPSSFSSPIPGVADKRAEAGAEPNLQALADKLVLQAYAPPAALVNDKGDIFYISGKTGKYLEPAAGKANWNIFAMARESLRNELFSAFQKATRNHEKVKIRCARIECDREDYCVEILVDPLKEEGHLHGLLMIVFTDIALEKQIKKKGRKTASVATVPQIAQLEYELNEAREDARITRESMQVTQEEFRSINEEMQSTNEEIQSTNEELMTSKEEMQSLNEELQTVNTELQSKVDELSRTNNDMKNLLNSTDIATVFLDNKLNVRRFTEQATKIFKLIPGDIGRPITDLASQLCYPQLVSDISEVLHSLVAVETPVGTESGKWYSIRIMPYRTLDNRIEGVVITFADITESKKLEAILRSQHQELKELVTEAQKSGKERINAE